MINAESTSGLGDGNVFPTLISSDRVPMIYGVFTTPRSENGQASIFIG